MTDAAPHLNPNLLDTGTPPIPQARAWLAAYDGSHGPAINLSQAVPGTPPPPEMLERLGTAASSGETASYGPIRGDARLVEAYATHVGGLYQTSIAADEIAITAGCNEAFFVAALAVAKAGEAVMLPAPWYFNHEMTLRMLGISALPLPTHADRGFVPDPEEARSVIEVHRRRHPSVPVRAIVLVTPNNPTGAVYPAETVARFAALAETADCWLLLDETYRDFLPVSADGAVRRPHDLFASPDWRRRLIQLYSFSKAYCIPGHRVGAMIGPAHVMAEITKILDCIQICAPRAPQSVLAWAIPALADWRRDTARLIARRADLFEKSLVATPAWRVQSIGAYFAYVRHPQPHLPSVDVAHRLAETFGVLALPGSYFGPGQTAHLRFAFANVGDEVVSQAGRRLALALAAGS